MNVDTFMSEAATELADTVQLMGCAENAGLIEKLYDAHRRKVLPTWQRIELASPATCPDPQDPLVALASMWETANVEGTCGRLVTAGTAEYMTYAIIAELERNDWDLNAKVREIVKYHPAWPVLSFITTCDVDQAIVLLSLIVDPRWYVDPFRPNRTNRLLQLLGVTKRNASFLAGKEEKGDRRVGRCQILTAVWMPDVLLPPPDSPGSFLHRIMWSSKDICRGIIKANRAFVRFLREVWMQNLAGHRKLFEPRMFFKSESEVQSYDKHLTALGNRISSFDTR
jgi:hypothetical protein